MDLSWLPSAISGDDIEKSDTHAIKGVIAGLNALLKERQFQLINHILNLIPVSKISPEIMVTLLRTTAAVNRLIPAWHPLLMRIRTELEARRLPSKKILIGLL